MTEQKPVFVKYIGSKPVKKDTVCHTDTIWAGKGDIQLIPRSVALKLVRHRKVWVPASAEEAAKQEAIMLGEASAEVVNATINSEEGSLRAAEEPDEPAPRDRREVGEPSYSSSPVPTEEEELLDDEDEDDGPAPVQTAGDFELGEMSEPAGEDLVEADEPKTEKAPESLSATSGDVDLVKIIKSFPEGDPEYFSEKTGAPLIAKIREVAGDKSIAAVQVKKAWEKLNG